MKDNVLISAVIFYFYIVSYKEILLPMKYWVKGTEVNIPVINLTINVP